MKISSGNFLNFSFFPYKQFKILYLYKNVEEIFQKNQNQTQITSVGRRTL